MGCTPWATHMHVRTRIHRLLFLFLYHIQMCRSALLIWIIVRQSQQRFVFSYSALCDSYQRWMFVCVSGDFSIDAQLTGSPGGCLSRVNALPDAAHGNLNLSHSKCGCGVSFPCFVVAFFFLFVPSPGWRLGNFATVARVDISGAADRCSSDCDISRVCECLFGHKDMLQQRHFVITIFYPRYNQRRSIRRDAFQLPNDFHELVACETHWLFFKVRMQFFRSNWKNCDIHDRKYILNYLRHNLHLVLCVNTRNFTI